MYGRLSQGGQILWGPEGASEGVVTRRCASADFILHHLVPQLALHYNIGIKYLG